MASWGMSWLETATQKFKEVERSIDAAVGITEEDLSSPPVGKTTTSAPTTPAALKSGTGRVSHVQSGTPQPAKSAGWSDAWSTGTAGAEASPTPGKRGTALGARSNGGASAAKPGVAGAKGAKPQKEEPSLEELLNSDVLLSKTSPVKKPPLTTKSASASPTRAPPSPVARRTQSASGSLNEKLAKATPSTNNTSAERSAVTTDAVSPSSSTPSDAVHAQVPEDDPKNESSHKVEDLAVNSQMREATTETEAQPPQAEVAHVMSAPAAEPENKQTSDDASQSPTNEQPPEPQSAVAEDNSSAAPEFTNSGETEPAPEEQELSSASVEVQLADAKEADTVEEESKEEDDLDKELEQEWARQVNGGQIPAQEGESIYEYFAVEAEHHRDKTDSDADPRNVEIEKIETEEDEPVERGSEIEVKATENPVEDEEPQEDKEESKEIKEERSLPETTPVTQDDNGKKEEAQVKQLERQVTSLSRVLADRERQVEALAREHAKLQDINAQVAQEKEEALKLARDREVKMSTARDDFTNRIAALERSLSAMTKERDKLRQELRKREDKDLEDSEKDQIMTELRSEGDKLSKKQLKLESTIKQLRAKEKESEATITSLKEQLASAEAQIENAQAKTRDNDALLSKYNDMIAGLKEAADVANRKSEEKDRLVAAAQQRVAELETEKEKAIRQTTEARKLLQAAEERREVELEKARNEVKDAVHEANRKSEERESTLSLTVQQLRSSLSNLSEQYAGREELLRQEIQSLQGRLAATESRTAEVSTTIAEATAPLVRQLDSLHQAHSHAIQEKHRIEHTLRERIKEEEERAEAAHAELQRTQDNMAKIRLRMRDLEKENEDLHAQLQTMQRNLDDENKRAEQAEKEREAAHAAVQAANKANIQLQKEFDSKLSHEVAKIREQEQARYASKEQDLSRQYKEKQPEQNARPNINPYTQHSNWPRPLGGDKIDSRHRDVDVANLQSLLAASEKTKNRLEDELVALTASNDSLSQRVSELEAMEGRMAEIQRHYNTALELVGEKTEQVEELRADLADMKELYRTQISELLTRIDVLSRH